MYQFNLYKMIYITLHILLLHVLTLFFFLFNNNSVKNNSDNENKEEDEDDSYKGEDDPDDGKSIGSFVCNGSEIDGNVHHVHVVMNHNPQEESMGINFTSLSSHLAFFYDPPLGPFSKFAHFNFCT
jgi:hypothetical protein